MLSKSKMKFLDYTHSDNTYITQRHFQDAMLTLFNCNNNYLPT